MTIPFKQLNFRNYCSSVKTRVQAESDAKKLQEAKELPSPQVKRNGAPRKLTSAQKIRVRDVIRHVWRDGVSIHFPLELQSPGCFQAEYIY